MTDVTHQKCHWCKSSDAFSYSPENGLFRCFSCGATPKIKRVLYYGPDRIEMLTSGGSVGIQEEGMSLEPYYRDYRGISKDTLEEFDCYFTEFNGKETIHWTYPNAVKHRELPKGITVKGTLDGFFLQERWTGGKMITITEGEEDAMSVLQMAGWQYPVVSVPGALPSKAFWQNAREYLSHFDKIVLSVDNDEAGNKLAEMFFRMFPAKTYRVNHGSYKDANEFLQAGEFQLFKTAWWNAQKMRPEGILTTADDFLSIYHDSPNYEYFPTGLPDLDEKMLGIHKGAFTLILAPTGVGKTEFMRYLEWQCYKNTNYSFAMCHGEETKLRSLLGLVSYDLQDNLIRKDLIEDKGMQAMVEESLKRLGDSGRIYNFQIRVDEGVDEIIEQVRFLRTAMGVDYIMLEPIQDFVSGDTSTKESLLTDLANKMKRLASEIDVGIVVIAHANDDGEVKYCRSLVQSAAYEIVLERDQMAEDPEEQNRTKVFVGRKNRTGGGSGPAGALVFDRASYTLTPEEGPQEPPTPSYSKPTSLPARSGATVTNTEELEDDLPF